MDAGIVLFGWGGPGGGGIAGRAKSTLHTQTLVGCPARPTTRRSRQHQTRLANQLDMLRCSFEAHNHHDRFKWLVELAHPYLDVANAAHVLMDTSLGKREAGSFADLQLQSSSPLAQPLAHCTYLEACM